MDNYPLVGIVYKPQGKVKANIVVANAAGVPQEFYRHFAQYMTQFGYQVFTFDYRGIGKSSPRTLNGFQMNYLDWGYLDLSGVVEKVSQQNFPIFLIGHSYGGHALGLMSNHQKITACYNFGSGTGWKGFMSFSEQIKMSIMWNIIFPAMVLRNGFLPWSKLRMGEDLPLNVYLQWKTWCKYPNYFFDDPKMQYLHEQYAFVKTPIFAVSAVDDAWAMPVSRDAFMKHFQNSTIQYIDLHPQKVGMNSIGHMGYFHKGAYAIWFDIVKVFDRFI